MRKPVHVVNWLCSADESQIGILSRLLVVVNVGVRWSAYNRVRARQLRRI